MNRVALGGVGGLVDGFTEGRVGVNGARDLLVGRLHADGEAEFGDHLGGIRPDDMRAKDFAVFLAHDEFDEALAFAHGKGFAAGHEREFAHLEFDAFFLRCALGEADAGDLRLAVSAPWEEGDFFRRLAGEHAFHALDGFVAGNMGEPRWSDDVSSGVDPFDAGFVAVVRLEVALGVGLKGNALRHEWGDADGDEGDLGLEGFCGLARDGEADTFIGGLGLVDFRAGEEFDALLGEGFLKGLADLGILDGKDVRHHLNHGHLGAEGVEEVGKLDADGSGSDDNDVLWLVLENHGLAAADDTFAIKREARHLAADDAGGDEDVRCVVARLFAVLVSHLNHARLRDFGLTADVVDFVFLEEHLDAASEAVGDLAAPADNLVPLVGEAFDLEPEVGCVVFDGLVDLRVFEERFGGNTAPVKTGAAGAVHFNNRYLFSELPGTDRSHVTRGTATNHNQIIISHSF